LLPEYGFAQNKNHIFLEVLGSVPPYSVNYEKELSKNFAIRAGASYFSEKGKNYFAFPLMLNYRRYSKLGHYLEFGAGAVFVKNNLVNGRFAGDLTLGKTVPAGVFAVCFQYNSGATLRLAFTPHLINSSIKYYAGFSFGIKF